MNYLIVAAAVLAIVGYVCFLVIQGVSQGVNSVSKSIDDQKRAREKIKAERAASEERTRTLALAAAEQELIEDYRAQNPVRIVGIPNPDAFRNLFALLDDYVVLANAHRPQLPQYVDKRFRALVYPSEIFDLARPHPGTLSNTEPRKITLTSEDVVMRGGLDASHLYSRANGACDFPCEPASYRYLPTEAPKAKPTFPNFKIPPKTPVRLVGADGVEMDAHDELQAKAYQAEFARVANLRSLASQVQTSFDQKYAAALEAQELMEIYLEELSLKWRDAEATLLQEFEQAKVKYERECQKVTQPIKSVQEGYRERAQSGVRAHFELALCNLSLPLPEDYPWEVLYDQNERVLQVNQCVPSLPDVSVVRTDSKRPPAKREAEAVLRRYVPAVALQLAHCVALNDLQGDVDKIAINCWSRFFDPASGKLKDAFVASLSVQKGDVSEIILQRADALEAFRASGAYRACNSSR